MALGQALFSLSPVVAALIFGLVLTLPWEREVVKDFQRDHYRLPEWDSWSGDGFTRESQSFDSHGTRCEGWLYLPTAQGGRRRVPGGCR